ncbi:copper chaperone PCu(A)C [Elioraea sp.]|uniref:copper chaperone PCu(A)C n=1 Tax=Elioraea sp. TaxID=2185103 RepID=UPI003F72416D
MITRRSALALALAAVAAPAAAHHDHRIEVQEPWARAALAGRTSAAYMTLVNPTETPDRLVSAASPVAQTVELHAHLHDGGVMRMRPVAGIEVHPGEPSVLAPGGLHVMLIGLMRDLRRGETIRLSLTFEKAGKVEVEVPVLAAGARGPEGHGGHGRHTH